MKKFVTYILNRKYKILATLFLVVIVFSFIPHFAHADDACAVTSPLSCLKDALVSFAGYICYSILYIAAWILGLAGLLFDNILQITVVNMKANTDGITAITAGWAIIRDVGNSIFIFMLLYIAICYILNIKSGDTLKLVRNLIIIGLLVNFSLFFTKALIDISNIVSVSFYNLIIPSCTNNTSSTLGCFSATFVRPLGIQSIFNPDPTTFVSKFVGIGSLPGMITLAVLGSIFLFFITLTFLVASALFVVRFVILVFLMVLSSLAFFAFILPNTRKYFDEWKDTLLGQLIFAPLYMLLIFLVVAMFNSLSTISGVGGGGNVSSLFDAFGSQQFATGGGGPLIGAIFNFIIIIVFLNVATVIALQQAGKGSKYAGAATGWIGTKFKTIRNQSAGYVKRGIAPANVWKGTKTTARLAGNVANGAVGVATLGLVTPKQSISKAAARTATGDNALGGFLKRTEANGNIITRNLARGTRNIFDRTTAGYREKVTKEAEALNKDAETRGAATSRTRQDLQNAEKNLGAAQSRQTMINGEIADLEARQEGQPKTSDTYINLQSKIDARKKEKADLSMKITETESAVKKFKKQEKAEKTAQQLKYIADHKKGLGRIKNVFTNNKVITEKAIADFKKGEKPANDADQKKARIEQYSDMLKDSQSDEEIQKILVQARKVGIKEMDPDALKRTEVIKNLTRRDLESIKKDNSGKFDAVAADIAEKVLNQKDPPHAARSYIENAKGKGDFWDISDSKKDDEKAKATNAPPTTISATPAPISIPATTQSVPRVKTASDEEIQAMTRNADRRNGREQQPTAEERARAIRERGPISNDMANQVDAQNNT